MEYILVVVLQFLFQIMRVKSNIAIVKKNKHKVVFYTFLIQILWLFTTYFGVISLIKHNYLLACCFVISGTIGSLIAVKNYK